MSFSKKLVTPEVTVKMSKLGDNACLWSKKTEFHFFHFHIFGYCRETADTTNYYVSLTRVTKTFSHKCLLFGNFSLKITCTCFPKNKLLLDQQLEARITGVWLRNQEKRGISSRAFIGVYKVSEIASAWPPIPFGFLKLQKIVFWAIFRCW